MKRTVIGAAVLALGISTVGVASADKPGDTDTTKTSKATESRDCGDGDSVALTGSQMLWPPNHKLVDQSATATDGSSNEVDGAANATTLLITVASDELINDVGDGNTDFDWDFSEAGPAASGDPSATVPFRVRAERSGKNAGRTYTIHWDATFDGTTLPDGTVVPGSKSCSSTEDGQAPFTIFVPHDQGKGNDA